MYIGTHRLLCPHRAHILMHRCRFTRAQHTCLHVSTDTLIYASLHLYQQMICTCQHNHTHVCKYIQKPLHPCTETPLVLVLAPGWYCPLLETADVPSGYLEWCQSSPADGLLVDFSTWCCSPGSTGAVGQAAVHHQVRVVLLLLLLFVALLSLQLLHGLGHRGQKVA